jgi:hypothetical protein
MDHDDVRMTLLVFLSEHIVYTAVRLSGRPSKLLVSLLGCSFDVLAASPNVLPTYDTHTMTSMCLLVWELSHLLH